MNIGASRKQDDIRFVCKPPGKAALDIVLDNAVDCVKYRVTDDALPDVEASILERENEMLILTCRNLSIAATSCAFTDCDRLPL